MGTAYIYAPFTGYCTSKISNQTYCVGGATHAITGSGYNNPIDLFTGGSQQWIDFNGSQTIKSVIATKATNMCLAPSPPAPWRDAVDFKMFDGLGGSGNVIGYLRFGHIVFNTPQMQFGVPINTSNGRVFGIGWTAPNTCGCNCFIGVHVHLEAKNHNQYNTGLENCASYPWATYNSTFIYRYQW